MKVLKSPNGASMTIASLSVPVLLWRKHFGKKRILLPCQQCDEFRHFTNWVDMDIKLSHIGTFDIVF